MVATASETIGSGGSYPTFAAWWSELPTGSTWTEDYVAELLSDTASDDVSPTFGGNMGGFKARIFTNAVDRGNGGPSLRTLSGSQVSGMIRTGSGGTGTHTVEFDGIGIENTHASGVIAADFGGTFNLTFKNSYMVSEHSTSTSETIDGSWATVTLENTIIVTKGCRGADLRTSTTVTVKNCGIFGISGSGTHGILLAAGHEITGSIVIGYVTTCIHGSTTGDYNVSGDTSGPGANTIKSVTLTDNAAATGNVCCVENLTTFDFRLKTSTGGTNVPIDIGVSGGISTDALGVTRDASPDAGPFEFVAAGGAIAIGIATETDSAFSINAVKTIPINVAAETDSAFAIVASKARAIGIASETDIAIAMNIVKSAVIGAATETDSAFSIGHVRSRLLGLATEIDTAFPVVGGAVAAILRATRLHLGIRIGL